VTNKNKKRATGYRAPAKAEPEPAARKGFLDSLFSPRVAGSTSMPTIRSSLSRGVVTVASSPAIVGTAIAIMLLEWLVFIGFGYQGPFALLINQLGVPPVGTFSDLNLSTSVFGLQTGFIALLGFIVVRSIVLSIMTALVVDQLEAGGASRWSVVRAARILPVAVAVNVASVGLLVVSSFLGPLLGSGFGLLILMAALVGGVYLLGFATTIAATEDRRMPDALGRSVRAGRLPGAGNLTFAAIYVLAAIALLAIPGKPGSLVGVNPSIGAWVLALAVSLAHVAVLAALAFRYLSIADEVPEAPTRPAPRSRGRRR
jgi:hypothetical protein